MMVGKDPLELALGRLRGVVDNRRTRLDRGRSIEPVPINVKDNPISQADARKRGREQFQQRRNVSAQPTKRQYRGPLEIEVNSGNSQPSSTVPAEPEIDQRTTSVAEPVQTQKFASLAGTGIHFLRAMTIGRSRFL